MAFLGTTRQAAGELCSTSSTSAPMRLHARRTVTCRAAKEVTLLDYGAGNVRSVRNAIKKLGYTIKDVSEHVCASSLHSLQVQSIPM